MGAPNWLAALEPRAPDVVAVWNAIDDEGPTIRSIAFRREVRRRAGPGSAASLLAENEAIADALGAVLTEMPEPLLRAPGGEGDWNVAHAFVVIRTEPLVRPGSRMPQPSQAGASVSWGGLADEGPDDGDPDRYPEGNDREVDDPSADEAEGVVGVRVLTEH